MSSQPIKKSLYAPILKASDDFGFVLVPVLVPDTPDLQGDVLEKDDIELAAHDFVENSRVGGYMHKQVLPDVRLVESTILRSDTTINAQVLKAGTWLTAWRIYNQELRKLIKEGKIAGVSIGGTGLREPLEE